MTTLAQQIDTKLRAQLTLEHLEVINESDNHNVPPGSESHFKLILVSPEFEGDALIERHRRINTILAEELAGGIHALSLRTLTPQEWQAADGELRPSPECARAP